MPFHDFEQIKAETTFLSLFPRFELTLKRGASNSWRGPCPHCEDGGDRALVVTEGKGFYCFADRKGGDVIAFVAHLRDCSVKEAAAWIVGEEHCTSNSTRKSQTVPESEAAGSKLQPLSYLEHAHDAVVALGLDPEFCKVHGIGYAPRGVVRGSIAIPFRDEQGVLLGYIGVQDITYIPPDFTTNVVPLRKKA